MPVAKRGSTLRAQWLGQLLRKERERAGVTNKDAGEYLQRDGSAISRMEAGVTPARVSDVWALMNLYAVEDRMRPAFEQLSREIWRKGWWESFSGDVSETFIDHAWLEERAESLLWFEPVSIPGLFQTRQYAAELIRAADPQESEQRIEAWVDYRIGRQRVLTKDHPPTVTAILDESVLHRRVGGSAMMRAQLERLMELADEPHLDIRVLAFDSGAHASPDGAFLVVELPDPFPPVAYVHSPAGATYLEQEDAEHLVGTFERLDKVALGPEKSLDVIDKIRRTIC